MRSIFSLATDLNWASIAQFARYALVGGLGAFIEITIFSFLFRTELPLVTINFIAFQIAIIITFYLHLKYTFDFSKGSQDYSSLYSFFSFSALMYALWLFGTFFLYLIIEVWGWQPDLSKILQISIQVPVSFLLQKLWVFKARNLERINKKS